MESNLGARCQPKAVPALSLHRKLAGRKSGDIRLFRLRRPNEQCQPPLGARSQPRNGRDGPRSSVGRKRLERDEPHIQSTPAKFDSPAVENRYRQPATPLLTRAILLSTIQ